MIRARTRAIVRLERRELIEERENEFLNLNPNMTYLLTGMGTGMAKERKSKK